MLETGYHNTHGHPAYFTTHTYSEATVPRTIEGIETLDKSSFRKWLQSQRKNHGPFRYYAVGEYGDNTFRPHYHMALFSESSQQASAILESWQEKYGFITVTEITDERARYLANYTAKKLNKPDDPRLCFGQEPEFRISSRNPPIGADFINVLYKTYTARAGAQIIKDRGDIERTFRWNGRIYPIAPWILNKARERLGIPITHTERLTHPEYEKWHEIQEAIYDPETAHNMETHLNAKKIQRLYRTETVNI